MYAFRAPGLTQGNGWSVRVPQAMRARLILKPGQRGTRKLCAEYGERPVCVGYRYDEAGRKCH